MTDARKDPELLALEAEFPGWYCWRAHNSEGDLTSWMATRSDPAAGVEPTLMARDKPALREKLATQRAIANGDSPASSGRDAFWNPAFL